jgi:hypothetical protein
MATDVVEKKEPAAVKGKKSPFGKQKTPDQIVFRLIEKNEVKLRDDTPPYRPYIRFPNKDLIVWEDGTREIRWLPGFTTIFVDEQEKDGRVIPENILINPNNRFEIIDGYIKVKPHEKTKILFLDMCNRNINSKYRTGSIPALFERYSEEKVIEVLSEKQGWQQEAIDKAFKASEEQVAFHVKYLGIPLIDHTSGESRTLKAIQADYRQYAIDNPKSFLETYDDVDLKDKYIIEKALEENIISLTLIPGKATWTSSKEEICDIPIGSSATESLFNFSKTNAGEKMMAVLKK